MNNSRYLKTEFFECQCCSDEHTLKFTVDEEDGTIYTSVYLNDFYPWYYRIWIAIKYVFGYKSKFGAWDTTLLRTEDHPKMLELLEASNNIKIKKLQDLHKQNEPPQQQEEVAWHPV